MHRHESLSTVASAVPVITVPRGLESRRGSGKLRSELCAPPSITCGSVQLSRHGREPATASRRTSAKERLGLLRALCTQRRTRSAHRAWPTCVVVRARGNVFRLRAPSDRRVLPGPESSRAFWHALADAILELLQHQANGARGWTRAHR